jgi:drug/metabolite transporter (DMT)-like permease
VSTPARVPSWQADLALAIIAVIWGGTFVVVKNALGSASTMLFLTLRFTIATAALAVLYRGHVTSVGPSSKHTLRGGLLAGLFLIVSYFLQTQGLRFTTASKSAFITGLCAVLVPLLSALVYRKMPGGAELLGVLTATAGMALLTIRWGNLKLELGDALTLGCAFGFAAHIIVVGHYGRSGGYELLSLTQIAAAAALGWASFWWMETPRVIWSTGLVAALLVTGLLATALAFTVMAWAQQHTTATHTALIFSLEPVAACFTAWLVDGETLSPAGVVGAILILGGILLVELKPFGVRLHPS